MKGIFGGYPRVDQKQSFLLSLFILVWQLMQNKIMHKLYLVIIMKFTSDAKSINICDLILKATGFWYCIIVNKDFAVYLKSYNCAEHLVKNPILRKARHHEPSYQKRVQLGEKIQRKINYKQLWSTENKTCV